MIRSFEHSVVVLALVAALGITAEAQQLATFDPDALPAAQYAAVACNSIAVPGSTTAELLSPPAAALWFRGAIAADNDNQRLWYTTGSFANQVHRVPFADIGSGNPPTTFSIPGAFVGITGMVVDPNDASGNTLIMTDGLELASYNVATGILSGPVNGPPGAGPNLTGLAYNPFDNRIYTVDAQATYWSKPAAGGLWGAPTAAPAALFLQQATGISFCKTNSAGPMISFWNGDVLNPQTGASMPFPPSPTGTRHHRGLTFVALPVDLGGGHSVWEPEISFPFGFRSGDPGFEIHINSPSAPVVLLADIAPPTVGTTINGVGGMLFLNPSTALIMPFIDSNVVIATSLVGLPTGIGMTFQALAVDGIEVALSDAKHFTSHR